MNIRSVDLVIVWRQDVGLEISGDRFGRVFGGHAELDMGLGTERKDQRARVREGTEIIIVEHCSVARIFKQIPVRRTACCLHELDIFHKRG